MNGSLIARGMTRLLFTVVLILACASGITGLQYPNLSKNQQKKTDQEYLRQEQLKATNLSIINNLPSFGFNNLVADWLFLQFIQYFGDTDARKVTGYQLIPSYFQAIIEHDPRFESAYSTLSSPNTIFAGKPKLTVELLGESLEHLSAETSKKGYQLWVYKATDELLYLNDVPAAKSSYQKAIEWAEQSNEPSSKGIARYARRMLRFVESNPDTREGRIGAWTIILMTTGQEAVQKEAIKAIEELGGEVIKTPNGRIQKVRVK
ncbi:MAG: hypothetical protein GVY04_23685 [Cyanobacteria bacterium]|jgi:hypothetical protein|nr:hypothetical protein [Cyanobacteria bacterium GSL.Bin1]